MADAHKNFAYTTVTAAPSPATSGTSLTVADGTVLPAVPFNATVWVTGANPLNSNAEIVRVTNNASGVLTIVRAQEGSTARAIVVGDQFAATITAKTLTDTELTITDGANSVESGSLRLSNANGVSVGINGSTVTFSHNGLTTAALSNHSHGNPQLNLTNLTGTTASNSGGFTLSLSAHPAQTVQPGIQSVSAGTTRVTTGEVVWSNSNGVSFGANGQTITASHNGLTTARASNDGVGLNTALTAGPLAWTVNSAGISLNAGSAAGTTTGFAGNLISGSLTNNTAGLNVSLNHPAWLTTAALSNHSHGNPTLALTNLSGTTASNSAGLTLSLSAAAGGGGADGYNVLAAGTQTATTAGTVLFENSNGVTFGMSGSTRITASHNGLTTARASNDGIGLATAQSNVTWTVNSNGLSLDGRGYAGTGTTFNGANISGSVTLNSVGVNLSLSVAPGGGGADGYNMIAAGTQTAATTGTVLFQNSNGITFGMSNSSVVTASHNGLTTARASNDAVGLNTALTAGPLAWTVNSSGISLNAGSAAGTTSGFAGNLISGSMTHNTAGLNLSLSHPAWLTTAMASNAITLSNIRISAGTTSNLLSALTFNDGNGVSFGLNASTVTASHNGLTSQSNQNVTAANGGFAFQTLSFSNLNGISFGTSAGSAITASHNGLTTARASNDGIGLGTAQTNVTWTVNSGGLSLNAAGYAGTGTTFAGANISASMTLNSNGLNLSASVAAGGGGGVTPVASASNGSFSFTTLAFSNANNVTFGTSAGSIITASVAAPGAAAEANAINLLGANTAGNTTATGSTIGWSGQNLTLSGTNGSQVVISAPATSSLSATGILSISTNGSTISIGVGHTVSGMLLAPFGGLGGPMHFAQSSISLGQNSLYFYPVQLEDYLTIDHVRMPVLITNSSSAVSSGRKGQTFLFGIYSRNATNNTIYTNVWSTSHTIAASYSSNVSWAQSMITAIGNSTSYNSVTASSAGLNLSASLHGPRELIIPVSTLLPPGEYWMALAASTSSAGTVGNVLNISNLAVAHQTYNRLGLSTNATGSGFFQFMGAGTYSATTAALPASISATQINQLGTLPILFAATGTV